MKRLWFLGAIALLVCGPPGAGEEKTEVKGSGYGATSRPTETDKPPADYGSKHDPGAGEFFNGVGDYDLEQGADDDNKQRWRDHNYIHWIVHAATLEAEGQATDGDPGAATEVTSEAWGAQIVEVKVNVDEADYVIASAENRIMFEYSYSISGPAIGEGSVRLRGTAFDIHGRDHQFQLSANTGGSETEFVDKKLGLNWEDYRAFGLAVTTQAVGLSSARKFGGAVDAQISARVTRRHGSGTSDSGATPSVQVKDSKEGKTPFLAKFQVFSDGDAGLVARASKSEENGVVVKLKKFRVLNSLHVYKTLHQASDGPEPGDPPTPGSPPPATTPGGDPPPIEPPEPGPETPGGGEEPFPIDPGWYGYIFIDDSLGLEDELGARPGELKMALNKPAARDVQFLIEPLDDAAIDFDGEDRLVIREGRMWGGVRFHGREEGFCQVGLRLIDEDGAPTETVLFAFIETFSTAAWTQPHLWVSARGHGPTPGRDVCLRGIAGTALGALRIGRTGFAAFDTAATTVTLEVADPDGILGALPATVSIPAGAESVELPLELKDIAGDAVIALATGSEELLVTVRAAEQEWSGAERIRVPVGATAPVPFRVAMAETADRVVTGTVADASVASLSDAAPTTSLRAGETAWFLGVRGGAPGGTSVQLTSVGLPTLTVPVEVVAADVTLADGKLELRDLQGRGPGEIHLRFPAGIHVASLAAPAGIAIEGVGTGEIVVTIEAEAGPLDAVSLTLALSGEGEGSPEVEVLDLRGASGSVNSYRIEMH